MTSSPASRRVLEIPAGDPRSARFVDPPAGGRTLEVAPGDDVGALDLDGVQRVVLSFPKASEGRPFTQARVLRERGFEGRLRAVGAVVVDALPFLGRCGFDEVILRDARDEEHALAALTRFSVRYQGDVGERRPLFARCAR